MPATVEYRGSGTMVSPWPPSTNAVTFSTDTLSSRAMNVRKRAESRTPAMPTTRLCGKPGLLPRELHHRVEGVRDEHQDGVLRARGDLLDDRADDLRVLEQQVVARHAGLAREPGGDDDDVGVRGLVVAVGADEARVVAVDRPRLREIERLALRNALDDVDQDDVAKLLLDYVLCDRRADVAGAHYRDLRSSGHQSPAMFWLTSAITRGPFAVIRRSSEGDFVDRTTTKLL